MNRYEQIFGKVEEKQPASAQLGTPDRPTLIDPRPDHTQDHHYWELILTNAKALFDSNPQPVNNAGKTTLFKILHGLRCGGARLEETKQAYKLHPGDEEFADPEEWAQIKQRWLEPVKDDLVRLFRLCKIGQVVDEELPEEVAKTFKDEHAKEDKQLSFSNIG